jgi:pyruvate,orthophosphate dikinase
MELLAIAQGRPVEYIRSLVSSLHEVNPMMGHRGCRLAVTYPEIAKMQTQAVIRAAINVQKKHPDWTIEPEIMIPLVGEIKELKYVKNFVVETADAEIKAAGADLKYQVGTMIEIPRAALTADEIAKEADFFCFGTNDLTQMTYGFSRDDAGKFLGYYYDAKILENDPFARLDRSGVGKLMKMTIDLGKPVNPKLHCGICGEHGGDPSSIEFCNEIGLDYVSCSPFRVPIARLAAAQAAIAADAAKEAAAKAEEEAFKAEVERKVEAAKAALKDAGEKFSSAAMDAGAELKDFLSAGVKSLVAGWEEVKKTFGEQRNK